MIVGTLIYIVITLLRIYALAHDREAVGHGLLVLYQLETIIEKEQQ